VRAVTDAERLARFLDRCRRIESCVVAPTAYPRVRQGGRPRSVRRLLWELRNGTIPEGRSVLTTCGRVGCVAVDHLRLAAEPEPKPPRPTGVCTRCGLPHDRRMANGRGRCRRCDAAYARARYRRRRARALVRA
jgi:hypothetical protein